MPIYSGEGLAGSEEDYGVFPASVAEQIYSEVIKGYSPADARAMQGGANEIPEVQMFRVEDTLPPYDWWRAIDPDTEGYYEESDFDSLDKANLDAPLYARASLFNPSSDADSQFPAKIEDCDPDAIGDNQWYYIKNRNPNMFAMRGDLVYAVEIENEHVMVSGGSSSIDGYIVNTSDRAESFPTSPTAVQYSEVILLGRAAPNVAGVFSAWTECVPNMYTSMDVLKNRTCRIARSGGIWVYESIGCEEVVAAVVTDTEIFGEFDGKERYEELELEGYYSQSLNME